MTHLKHVLIRGSILAILAGCAQAPRGQPVWRDLQAGGNPALLRTQAALDQDSAQCDYELAQAQSSAPQRTMSSSATDPYGRAAASIGSAMLSGPAPDMFERCMRARGWEFRGYE